MTEDEEQPTPEKYKALLSAFAKQERTMKKVAAVIRVWNGIHFHHDGLSELCEELDPREPISEADAAEKFSQDCETRKPK